MYPQRFVNQPYETLVESKSYKIVKQDKQIFFLDCKTPALVSVCKALRYFFWLCAASALPLFIMISRRNLPLAIFSLSMLGVFITYLLAWMSTEYKFSRGEPIFLVADIQSGWLREPNDHALAPFENTELIIRRVPTKNRKYDFIYECFLEWSQYSQFVFDTSKKETALSFASELKSLKFANADLVHKWIDTKT